MATKPNAFSFNLLANIHYVINLNNLKLYEPMHLKDEEQIMHSQYIIRNA